MDDNKKNEININAPVTGINNVIGGQQSIEGDQHIENVTIQYGSIPDAPADSPLGKLKAQLAELETALNSVPAEQVEAAKAVEKLANVITEEAKEPSPNKTLLTVSGEGLKKAAENLATVAPIAVKIAMTLLLLG